MMKLAGMLALFAACVAFDAPAKPADYATAGDCGGFPKVALDTGPGLCVGLVASKLGFPRGVAVLGTDIYVVDMGGWRRHHGRLWRIAEGGHGAPAIILSGLDEPSALLAARDGTLYLGVLGKIVRFDPRNPAQGLVDIVTGLPTDGRHPLAALAEAPDGSLFINVGSATDNCESAADAAPDPNSPCPEVSGPFPRASIWRVVVKPAASDERSLFAAGLRNSLALAVLPDGSLVAGVNGRDQIDAADPALDGEHLPHDLLVWVKPGANYGWPYCYDDGRASPEYRDADCSRFAPPTRLLPAHAAPLGALYYGQAGLPPLRNKLLVTYHGYRAAGHRIVALPLDSFYRPAGEPEAIVAGWDAAPGIHPMGAPVSLARAPDGAVLVTEDRNGTLLRLSGD